MRDLTKEHQAASGRRLHAFTLTLLSAAGITAAATLPARAADLTVTAAQQAEAQRTARQGIPIADLAPNAPSQYTVRNGDTLWGISGRYLRQPWRWPELWGMNQQQIRNPHLIYPGQILYLIQRDGRAWLSTTPAGNGTVQLSPRVRGGDVDGAAILSISASDIEPFLIRPLVVDEGTLATSARIVAVPESRVYLGRDDSAYARGIAPDAPAGSDWQAYRPVTPVRDPVTNAVLGYEAEYEGNVRLARGAQGPDAVSTLQVTQAQQEMGVGTMLMPQPAREAVRYVPHAPDVEVDGRVAKVYGGVEFGGAKQVVVLNVGSKAGLEPGQVLALSRTGETVHDRTDQNRSIRLPDERYGLAFVFRVFPGVAYALVTDASNVIAVGDRATSPR
ncbi:MULTISPECIES: LysM peptidoglycan-binding domain-containing protein [Cupriavidus]|uniref:LysM peptidoglycan-binding domain-containing protein n=1 Tax=Cupriavidus oxalaticus TaxID=96344 RepID=A0A4P7LM93_9BURK|nr:MULTISPECIES: LysM peptidoglycan-binding domain-containing protein [Cupriavidus]MBF6988033.1 LysM peptidoglycan-binding domain-containing protein [Cupriavidus sp. IK-TO18]QBY54743.1 LysM peptidoglycan-binding domain-containing protein [Cupriavidus oxalaticus]